MRLGKMSSLKNLLLRAKQAAKVETFLQKKIVKLKGLMHYFARKKTNFHEFFHNFFFAKIKMFIKIDKKVRQNEGSLECKQTLTNFLSNMYRPARGQVETQPGSVLVQLDLNKQRAVNTKAIFEAVNNR